MDEVEVNPDEEYLKIQGVDLDELELLRQELESVELRNPDFPINDLSLKVRVGKFCSKLIAKTLEKESQIRKVCSVLCGAFSWHAYGDELDDVIRMAKELEDKSLHKDEAVFELFRLMDEILEGYVEENLALLENQKKENKN